MQQLKKRKVMFLAFKENVKKRRKINRPVFVADIEGRKWNSDAKVGLFQPAERDG